jgi:hypothetical protein
MDKRFHIAWHMKGHVFTTNSETTLHFKSDMIQLFWVMKEFSHSTKKILVAFAKFFHYPND